MPFSLSTGNTSLHFSIWTTVILFLSFQGPYSFVTAIVYCLRIYVSMLRSIVLGPSTVPLTYVNLGTHKSFALDWYQIDNVTLKYPSTITSNKSNRIPCRFLYLIFLAVDPPETLSTSSERLYSSQNLNLLSMKISPPSHSLLTLFRLVGHQLIILTYKQTYM